VKKTFILTYPACGLGYDPVKNLFRFIRVRKRIEDFVGNGKGWLNDREKTARDGTSFQN
jgi:hypothetical protein